jgi:hypothetical protein
MSLPTLPSDELDKCLDVGRGSNDGKHYIMTSYTIVLFAKDDTSKVGVACEPQWKRYKCIQSFSEM